MSCNMAFSKSIQKAQTFSVCQFCEESPDIKWRCINCDLFLCQLCNTRIHSKSKSCSEHQIINLKDCATEDAIETIRKVGLKNMICVIHIDQKCFMHCKDCDQPLCSECLIQSHHSHTFSRLGEVYDVKVNEIKDLKRNIESDLPFFQQEEDNLQQKLSGGDKQFQEIKANILQQEKEIKDAAAKYAQENLKELETKWRPSEAAIKKEISVMKHKKEDLKKRKDQLDQVLQSHQACDIINTSKSVNKTIPQKSVNPIKLEKMKFIPGKILSKSKCTVFGKLYRVPELELVQTYQTGIRTVTTLLNCDNNSLLIGSSTGKTIQKVKFENDNIKIEKEVKDTEVYDVAFIKNGDVLVSTRESDLNLYKKSGKLQKFQSFSPLNILGVHVNKQNAILLGLSDLTNFPTRMGKIVVLTEDFNIKHTYEYDPGNQRLFTHPRKILTINNDNICVIDTLNDHLEGRLVVIDKEGKLKWTYTGCDSINLDQSKFRPADITVTSTGLMVISDRYNHALHILNQNGELILCKVVKDLGIILPYSLDIDLNGMLWIGCDTYIGDKKNAKIHAVKLT